MREKDIKTLIIIIIPMIAVGVIAYLFSHKDNKEKETNMIVNSMNFWQYKDGHWKDFGNIDEFDWKEYSIYNSSSKYINRYFITMNEKKTYFFDDNDDSHDINDSYIAFSNKDVKPIDYFLVYDDVNYGELKIVNTYLKMNKINYKGNGYSTFKKYRVDINNDDKEDYIYVVSNELYSENNEFYLVFALCNNKYITISNQINKNSYIGYDVGWILNMSHDGYNNLVLTYSKDYNSSYYLYTYNVTEKKYYDVFEG